MSEKSRRRKSILFLISLIMFGIFVVSKTKGVDNIQENTQEYVLSEKVETNDESCNLEQDIFLEIDENFKPLKEIQPGMVLSEQDVLGTGCVSPFYSYSSEKICARTVSFEADIDKKGRELAVNETIVSRDSSISLTRIEVPPLLNGSPTMDDSRRQIFEEEDGKQHWTLRPAGEMVNKEIPLGNAYPGDEQTQELVKNAEGSRTKPFGINYSISGTSNAQGSGKNLFSVSKYQINDCGADCRNYSNPTPEKFLSYSQVLGQSMNYPKYYENIPEQVDESINNCDTNTEFVEMDLDTDMKGCTPSPKDIAISFVKKIKNIFEADKCSSLGESDENCVNTASIVVIMESPWGSKQDCADGLCVTEYNELRNGNFTVPGGDNLKKVYVLTKCYANIEGQSNVPLSCAWDIDYITQELEFQSHDNIPNEVFPDRMEYVNFHVKESETRSDPVYDM